MCQEIDHLKFAEHSKTYSIISGRLQFNWSAFITYLAVIIAHDASVFASY